MVAHSETPWSEDGADSVGGEKQVLFLVGAWWLQVL